MEQASRLAATLSSENIVEARDARTELTRLMAPERILHMWRQGQQEAAAALLNEAETVGNHDVYAVLGDGFKCLFDASNGKADAEDFLSLDTTSIVARFLVNGVSHDDLVRATSVRPALLSLLAVVPSHLAPFVGELLSASFKNERVLRLFDENNPESSENEILCNFLNRYTDVIPFIASATLDAFEHDPLLVANYLAITGIISRHMDLPQQLLERIEWTLTQCEDEFIFCFVCRSCAVALRGHDSNNLRFASVWGEAAARRLGKCSHDACDAIYSVLGAASTTSVGWTTAGSLVREEELTRGLGSIALQSTVLSFMIVLVRSPHVADSFFSVPLLRTVWKLHRNPDDVVRERLWAFVDDGLSRESIMVSLAPLCASYLCSLHQDANLTVRGLQLQVAGRLVDHGGLALEVTERLQQFRSRGLYPPASVGIEAMSRR
ncbi:hypothetical protein DQ04_03191040 [Trypanosoma grayi]|uniref:hypothetical protein n=1 Tax=Trypanosoma grayi TaxID=71804 RepID=UPI0004F44B03|nr:hypothetical protein DQ04_03191040 [Trypanosoma grayi]KEG10880.1 hypothetical protein DQ04_03191040 [Trypanosoma grayi]